MRVSWNLSSSSSKAESLLRGTRNDSQSANVVEKRTASHRQADIAERKSGGFCGATAMSAIGTSRSGTPCHHSFVPCVDGTLLARTFWLVSQSWSVAPMCPAFFSRREHRWPSCYPQDQLPIKSTRSKRPGTSGFCRSRWSTAYCMTYLLPFPTS